jgi:hypothetical protein
MLWLMLYWWVVGLETKLKLVFKCQFRGGVVRLKMLSLESPLLIWNIPRGSSWRKIIIIKQKLWTCWQVSISLSKEVRVYCVHRMNTANGSKRLKSHEIDFTVKI